MFFLNLSYYTISLFLDAKMLMKLSKIWLVLALMLVLASKVEVTKVKSFF